MKKLSDLFSKINNFLNKNYFIINQPSVINFIFKKENKNIFISVPGFYMSFTNDDIWEGLDLSNISEDFAIKVSDLNNVLSTLKNEKNITVNKNINNVIFSSGGSSTIEIPTLEVVKGKSIKKCKDDCISISNSIMDDVLYRARACFYTQNHTPIYNTIKIISKDNSCKFVSGNGSLFCIQKIECPIKNGIYCVPYSCLAFLHELNKIIKDKNLNFKVDGNAFYVENNSFVMIQEHDLDYNKWPDESKILNTECEINCLFASDSLKEIRDNLQLSMLYKKDDELLITDFSIKDNIGFSTNGKIKTQNSISYLSSNSEYDNRIYTRLLLDLVNSMPDVSVNVALKTSKEEFRGKKFPIIASFNDENAEVEIICSLI